jgi:hypothetical protein
MELSYLNNKLKSLTGLENLDNYQDDFKKLIDCHNSGKFSLHTRMKLISQQIIFRLDNIYERINELLKYGRDSSSLEVFKLRYGDEEGERRFNLKINQSKQTLEKFIEKYGEIDGKLKYKKYCKSKSMSLEMCIKRHGEIKGPVVFREYWDTTGFGTSKRAFKKRFGNDWEKHFIEFTIKQGENNTLEAKILKYGEKEGTKKFKELNSKKSNSLSKKTLVEKMLKNGAAYDEIRIEIANRWDNTSIESFIIRYGEIDGLIKYEEYLKKNKESNPICIEYYEKRKIPEDVAFEIISKIQWERNSKLSRFSKESLFYFDKLNEIFEKRGKNCLYAKNELGFLLTHNEYQIYKKNRMFFYDCFIPELNLIIEYHGVRFHSDIDYNSTLTVSQNDIYNNEYDKDFFKKWIAEQRGYKVFILRSWEIKNDLNEMFDLLKFTEEEKCKFL